MNSLLSQIKTPIVKHHPKGKEVFTLYKNPVLAEAYFVLSQGQVYLAGAGLAPQHMRGTYPLSSLGFVRLRCGLSQCSRRTLHLPMSLDCVGIAVYIVTSLSQPVTGWPREHQSRPWPGLCHQGQMSHLV